MGRVLAVPKLLPEPRPHPNLLNEPSFKPKGAISIVLPYNNGKNHII
jgi:hypothetical protein